MVRMLVRVFVGSLSQLGDEGGGGISVARTMYSRADEERMCVERASTSPLPGPCFHSSLSPPAALLNVGTGVHHSPARTFSLLLLVRFVHSLTCAYHLLKTLTVSSNARLLKLYRRSNNLFHEVKDWTRPRPITTLFSIYTRWRHFHIFNDLIFFKVKVK